MLPPVRQLLPIPREVIDPADAYGAGDRPAPRWVLVNMITSLDGATAVQGRSGALGGPADKRVFAAIRALADVILVGAGTARAENYGPPSSGARLAIVSASLHIDPEARIFRDGYRPIVVTHGATDPARRAALEAIADVMVCGDRTVDLEAAIATFEGVIVCEGGPSLNGELIAHDLVDELCLTVAPLLAGGDSPRVGHGPSPPAPVGFDLAHLLEEDGYLFTRWVRRVSDASARSPS